MVKLELLQRVAQGVEGSLVAVVGIPQLGRDEDVLSRVARLLEPLAQGAATGLLVRVPRGRVDVSVASVQRGHHGIFSLLAVRRFIDAEGEKGDLITVVELDGARTWGRGVLWGTVPAILPSGEDPLDPQFERRS